MPQSAARIDQLPHYRVSASELAAWLEAQGADSWWSVDGDSLLTENLAFPLPAPELAGALRRYQRTLLLLDVREFAAARGEWLAAPQLDGVAYSDKRGDRVFHLCWEANRDEDWLLTEDKEMARISLGLNDGKH